MHGLRLIYTGNYKHPSPLLHILEVTSYKWVSVLQMCSLAMIYGFIGQNRTVHLCVVFRIPRDFQGMSIQMCNRFTPHSLAIRFAILTDWDLVLSDGFSIPRGFCPQLSIFLPQPQCMKKWIHAQGSMSFGRPKKVLEAVDYGCDTVFGKPDLPGF